MLLYRENLVTGPLQLTGLTSCNLQEDCQRPTSKHITVEFQEPEHEKKVKKIRLE